MAVLHTPRNCKSNNKGIQPSIRTNSATPRSQQKFATLDTSSASRGIPRLQGKGKAEQARERAVASTFVPDESILETELEFMFRKEYKEAPNKTISIALLSKMHRYPHIPYIYRHHDPGVVMQQDHVSSS